MTIMVKLIEDEELRKELREMLQGQVRSIVRSELTTWVQEEVKRLSVPLFEERLRESVQRNTQFYYQMPSEYIQDAAAKTATALVEKRLAEMNLEGMSLHNLVEMIVRSELQKLKVELVNK